MKYDEQFILAALSYLSNLEKLNLDISKIHLLSKREKETVKKINNIYRSIKLYKDKKDVNMQPIELEDAVNCTNDLLVSIFNSKKQQILDIDKLISFEDINYDESGVYYNLVGDQVVVNGIVLPNEYNGFNMSIFAHEKTHILTFQNLDIRDLFTSGLETLPVLIQKIIIYELETQFGLSYVSEFDQIVRINDCMKGFNILNSFSGNDLTKLDQYIKEYTRITLVNYLKAELSSELLLENYKFNRCEMIENLNKVFDKKISLQQFLNMYDANLLNKNLIPLLKQNTSKVKRISLIP